jgi:cytochrome c oxidase cbb3-type subunit III
MTKDIDDVTGVETTGHVWDHDLKELNKPLPKWWLYTFYATIIWAIGYWIVYPAWPTLDGYTKGVWGYSQRATVMKQIDDAKAAQSEFRQKLEQTDINEVPNDGELMRFAMASGKAAFGENCAPCHGRGAQGFPGYPNLNDDEWIWGGSLEDITATLRYGIRSPHEETRSSDMPRFGADELLEPKQISDVSEYVLSLSGGDTDKEAAARGQTIYAEQCVACHGEKGLGNPELGAPNLADAVWLYGSDKAEVMTSIHTGRGGMMPAWENRLDPLTIKSLALYVHSLGGGQP